MSFSETYKEFEIIVKDQKYQAYNPDLNHMLFSLSFEGIKRAIDNFYLEKK